MFGELGIGGLVGIAILAGLMWGSSKAIDFARSKIRRYKA
jgi:hypothetical protein